MSVAEASSYSSDSTWELPYAMGVALKKRQKKKKWSSKINLFKNNREFPGALGGWASGIVTSVVWVWSLAWKILHTLGTGQKTPHPPQTKQNKTTIETHYKLT